MIKVNKAIALSLLVFMPLAANAYDKYEKMNLTHIAASNSSNTFVAYVDREVPGSSCLETKRFKFDMGDPATNIIVSLITSAFISNKPVQFQYNIGDSNCLSKGQIAGYIKVYK